LETAQPKATAQPNPWQGSAAMVCGVLVLFSFAIGAAMGAYPGGTHLDPNQTGYDFWNNFWCDALRNPALNGTPNARGARMASIAMWVLSAGMLPFWGMAADLSVPPAASPNAARAAIRWLGTCAMLGMMCVTLLPSDQHPFVHGFLVTVAGPMGIFAAALAVQKGRSSLRVPSIAAPLGGLALLTAFGNLLQYARQFWFNSAPWPLLPALQKVATFFFLSWVVTLTAAALSGREFPRRRVS
jgi:hypothetical protein